MNLFGSSSFLTNFRMQKYKKSLKPVYHMQKGMLCKELEKLVAEAQILEKLLSDHRERSLLACYDHELEKIKLILLMKNQAEWQQSPTKYFDQALLILCLASRKKLAKLRKEYRKSLLKTKFKRFCLKKNHRNSP